MVKSKRVGKCIDGLLMARLLGHVVVHALPEEGPSPAKDVMPRLSRCLLIQSMTVAPSCTSPILCDTRVEKDASVVVVLSGIDMRADLPDCCG